MIHRSFRSLDRAPKLVIFTGRQWVGVILGSCAVLGLAHVVQLPLKPTITLYVFAVGLPAALSYVSESGGLQIGRLIWHLCRWRVQRSVLGRVPEGFAEAPGLLLLPSEEPLRERVDEIPAHDETLARFLAEKGAA
jgi:hypothetical protein